MKRFRINKTFPIFFQKEISKNTLYYQNKAKLLTQHYLCLEKNSISNINKTRLVSWAVSTNKLVQQPCFVLPAQLIQGCTTMQLFSQQQFFCLASTKKMPISESDSFFFNFSFDKSRLKSIVSWFFEKYGQYKTIQFLERLKEFGFGYATMGAISLGIDDLKIPNKKIALVSTAETKVAKDLMDYRNAKITGIERTQRLIYTWNQTNDMLKQEVLKYFETIDLFNPIYMMAFSGARGNMSQVRQLVGMRGLMSDPQGQIIDFPIQSNFREGLTLTEYLISTYGARKGIVDTALRTATAGYLTRRLVDVAQHVIVSQFDCGTFRGIFLFDMKEANKTIYSFQNRLIGRVLAQDIFSTPCHNLQMPVASLSRAEHPSASTWALPWQKARQPVQSAQPGVADKATTTSQSLKETNFVISNQNLSSEKTLIASRNQEIDSKLAFAIAKVSKKALVRSPLTCETPRLICQLCYGWSLSQGKLVSVGEAVGVIAAQSIGEPGTQLTMRTFHTGGVFAGGLTDQILAPFDGRIQYVQNIPGSCIRTPLSEIAFLTKMPGSFFVVRGDYQQSINKKDGFDFFSEHPLLSNDSSLTRSANKSVTTSQSLSYEKNLLPYLQTEWKKQSLREKNFHISEIYKIPAYAVLYLRNNEIVRKKQVLAQFSTVLKKSFQYGSAEQTLYSNLAGEFLLTGLNLQTAKNKAFIAGSVFGGVRGHSPPAEQPPLASLPSSSSRAQVKNLKKIDLFVEKRNSEFLDLSPIELKHDILWKSKNWTNIWILSGKVLYYSFDPNLYIQQGDCLKKTTVLNQILWKKKKNWNLSLFKKDSTQEKKITAQKTGLLCQQRRHDQNLFCLWSTNKQKNLKFSLSSNIFKSFKNTFSLYVSFRSSMNQEAFFLEQHHKKTKMKKFLLYNSPFSFISFILKNSEHIKNRILSNKHFIWNNSSNSLVLIKNKQIFHKVKSLPIQPFFLNLLSSRMKHTKKHKIQCEKFFKSKNDILFSRTFQKVFYFSSVRKQKNFSKKLFVSNQANVVLEHYNKVSSSSLYSKHNKLLEAKLLLQKSNHKNKKQLKQVFFKFSTFNRILPFFRFSSFSKIFNRSKKFAGTSFEGVRGHSPQPPLASHQVKIKSLNFFLISKKKTFHARSALKFSFLKNYSNIFWHISNEPFKTFLLTSPNYCTHTLPCYTQQGALAQPAWAGQRPALAGRGMAGTSLPSALKASTSWSLGSALIMDANQKKKMFSFKKSRKQKLIFTTCSQFPFFQSLIFKNSKVLQNFDSFQDFKETLERQILFKKTLFSFQYKKIRYNKYGYVFSITNKQQQCCSSAFTKQNNLYYKKGILTKSNNKFLSLTENSFQIFIKLKQSSFDFKNITNPGKQETNISFGNGNFVGKDFPTFLTYYFPQNYQTSTNGIFTISIFENNSKKQRYKKFLLPYNGNLVIKSQNRVELPLQKDSSTMWQKQKATKSKGFTAKERKKYISNFFNKKLRFLQNQTFDFVNQKMNFITHSWAATTLQPQHKNSLENSNFCSFKTKQLQKNMLNYNFVINAQKQFVNNLYNEHPLWDYNSSLTGNNSKGIVQTTSLPSPSLVSLAEGSAWQVPQSFFSECFVMKSANNFLSLNKKVKKFSPLKYLNKYNVQRFSSFELYTEEIFWIPQENYIISVLDFCKSQEKSLSSQSKKFNQEFLSSSKQNFQLGNKNEYISKMIFKKNPLFYLSNNQGKKKPFFSILEGIWNYSIYPNQLKYRQFSNFPNKKMIIAKKFNKIQQKLSLYKLKKEKYFLLANAVPKASANKTSSYKLLRTGGLRPSMKKSSLNFLKIEMFNFCNTKNKKLLFFMRSTRKNKNVLNIVSKFYFEKKFKKTMQRNFYFGIQKKLTYSNFESIKKLFFDLKTQNQFFDVEQHNCAIKSCLDQSLKFKKIGKNLQNQCFSCIPFQKFQNKESGANIISTTKGQEKDLVSFSIAGAGFGGVRGHNPPAEQPPLASQQVNNTTKSFSQNLKKSFQLQDQQLHLKIQSGWICLFPNSSVFINWHQKIMNIGHFFGKDFCFEQNKILQETLIFDGSSFFSDFDFDGCVDRDKVAVLSSTLPASFHWQGGQGLIKGVWAKGNYAFPTNGKDINSQFQQSSLNTGYGYTQEKKDNSIYTISFSNKNIIVPEKVEKNMSILNVQNSKNQQIRFCLKSLKTKKKSRFSNDGSLFASQIFASLFYSNIISEREKTFVELLNIHKKTELSQQTKIALFLRPMQYKLLENPKNYKKLFLNGTLQNSETKSDCISFISSLKIYKKYHSIILNLQKPHKRFLQNIENIESTVTTDFYKLYQKKKFKQNCSYKKVVYPQSTRNKFTHNWSNRYQQKNQTVFKFDLSKNLKTIPHFQLYSKKNMKLKFQSLLTWHRPNYLKKISMQPGLCSTQINVTLSAHTAPPLQVAGVVGTHNTPNRLIGGAQLSENKIFDKFLSEANKSILFSRAVGLGTKSPYPNTNVHQNFSKKKKTYLQNYFFSFYPIQFLPLSISNSSLNIVSVENKNSQTFPTFFLNSLKSKIDFSLCQKKAAFLNQRFYSFDFLKKFIQTSFWLNNDGKNIPFLYSINKNLFKNFWNMSFYHSIFAKNFVISELGSTHNFFARQSISKKNSLKKKVFLRTERIKTNIKIKSSIFKNFLFQKNLNFYANTQFFSPFDGEIISMYTNELNWWKKASDISTIQKLNTLFSVITKKDLFSINFLKFFKDKTNLNKFLNFSETNNKNSQDKNKNDTLEIKEKNILNSHSFVGNSLPSSSIISQAAPKAGLSSSRVQKNNKISSLYENNSYKYVEISMKYSLKTKQKHLNNLYKSVLKNQPTFDSLSSSLKTHKFFPVGWLGGAKPPQKQRQPKNFSVNKVIKTNKFLLPSENSINTKVEISLFVTKYENKIYKLKNLIIGYPLLSKKPCLGQFLVAGDHVLNFALRKPGQVVHLGSYRLTLRRSQPFLVSPKGILHLANTPFIAKNVPILTLPYQTLQSGDIVQGIPKVEQFFEARTTIQGRLFLSSIPILLKGIFERYKSILPLEQAVRQSILKIQQLIVDGVQRVYRSQGVSIVDKHLEVIVRQMTTKVQIIHGAQTGFFPGELVNLQFIERINKLLMVKVRYEPVVLGITRASLEVESFLSASSFQQTTKILALASISRKKDFLKGLKENILVGNLIPSGTGYMVLGKNL